MNLKNVALSCPHLRSNPNLQSCFKTRFPGRVSIRRDPSELPRCSTCDSLNRLYACVTCASLFCLSHAPTHAAKDHEIAVDVDRAELFCLFCLDQVYDSAFDRTVVLAQTQIGMKLQPTHDKNLRSKRRRIEYRPWAPDGIEKDLIERNASVLEVSGYPSGLRGMNNLGNTCFMNSVLQALFHTPPLRNYFLSDRHNRFFCQQGKNGVSKSSKLCLACDMDEMFSAVFSGERTPYSPAKFLYRLISCLCIFL